MPEKIIIQRAEFENTLRRMAYELVEKCGGLENVVLVGVHRGGVWLAYRIATIIQAERGHELPRGELDINLYRDDLSRIGYHPEIRRTEVPVPIDNAFVVLVDDVIYTGRTARAALDALMDLGRPQKVLLCVMVDRGGRELPIQPDIYGVKVPVDSTGLIEVRFREIHGEDAVVVRPRS